MKNLKHKEILQIVTQKRLEKYIRLINNGWTVDAIAKLEGVSRQAIHFFLTKKGFNYKEILKIRRAERKEEHLAKTRKKIRICKWCGENYTLEKEGAGNVYCSVVCYDNQHRVWSRNHNLYQYK